MKIFTFTPGSDNGGMSSLEGYRQNEMIRYLVMIVQSLLAYTKMDGKHIAKVFASTKTLIDTFDQLLNDELTVGKDYLEK